jgi:hypothetical protein
LYSTPYIVRVIKSRIKMGRVHSTHGSDEKVTEFIRKPEVKRPFGRPKHTCKNNIKINI